MELHSPTCEVRQHGERCYELRLNATRVLLDYGALLPPILRAAPLAAQLAAAAVSGAPAELASASFEAPVLADAARLDAVLVSSAEAMLALPLLTEHSPFNGAVYASSAALSLGLVRMLELARAPEKAHEDALIWDDEDADELEELEGYGLPACDGGGGTDDAQSASAAQRRLAMRRVAYSEEDVSACVAKVRGLSFGEPVTVGRGASAVTILALPSAASIGGAYWSIRGHSARFCYLAEIGESAPPQREPPSEPPQPPLPQPTPTCPSASRVADPTSISRELGSADALLLGALKHPRAAAAPAGLRSIVKVVCDACARGVSVLIPRSADGATPALVEALGEALRPQRVPVLLLSLSTDSALRRANTMPEWLDSERAERAYLPEPPFTFETIAAEGGLRNMSLGELEAIGVSDDDTATHAIATGATANYASAVPQIGPPRSPCVVIASDPSLRFGEASALLFRWRTSARAMLLLTDAAQLESVPLLLAPYQPLGMSVVEIPLDTRANATTAAAAIAALSPSHCILPMALAGEAMLARLGASCTLHGVALGAPPLTLTLTSRDRITAQMSAAAAATMPMQPLGPHGLLAARARMTLRAHPLTGLSLEGEGALSSMDAIGAREPMEAPPVASAAEHNGGGLSEKSPPSLLLGRPEPAAVVESLARRGIDARLVSAGPPALIELVGGETTIELGPQGSTVKGRTFGTIVQVQQALKELLCEL